MVLSAAFIGSSASSLTITCRVEQTGVGDVDFDYDVEQSDLTAFVTASAGGRASQAVGAPGTVDLDGDGYVSLADFAGVQMVAVPSGFGAVDVSDDTERGVDLVNEIPPWHVPFSYDPGGVLTAFAAPSAPAGSGSLPAPPAFNGNDEVLDLDAAGTYLSVAQILTGFFQDVIEEVLRDLGEFQRFNVWVFQREQVTYGFRYLREINAYVFEFDFNDGRPPLRIDYVSRVDRLEVWTERRVERTVFFASSLDGGTDALRTLQTGLSSFGKVLQGLDAVAKIVKLSSRSTWVFFFQEFADQYESAADGPIFAGFCSTSCLEITSLILDGLSLLPYSGAINFDVARLAAYYQCPTLCGLLPVI